MPFDYDENDDAMQYDDFFTKGQRGRRCQCGHRIGNVLGGLFHRIVGFLGSCGLDFLKQNRQVAVSNLIKTGIDIAKDVTSGKKVKDALKTRIPRV